MADNVNPKTTWVLSSPESFLTPFIVKAIEDSGVGKAMSLEYFSSEAKSEEISGRVIAVAVAFDDVDIQMLKDKSADFNRLIIIKTPGMQEVDFNCQTVEIFPGWIVGTGMTGTPMRLLKAINSGLYFHVDGVETARREIVHAADLAAAIVVLGHNANAPATVHFHDGTTPRLKEIAEAFASRLNGKRIYTLSRRAAKWVQTLLGTRDLYDLTIEQTPTTQPTEIKGITPRNTLRFITTHNYGNEDI